MVLSGEGMVDGKKVTFTAVPYYAWQNRGIHSLATLLIENPEKISVEKPVEKNAKMNTDGQIFWWFQVVPLL